MIEHNNIRSFDIIDNAKEKIRLEYLNIEQKENEVISETPAFHILILDNKYFYNYYSTYILEPVDQEAFNNLLEKIKKVSGINYVEEPNVVSEESKDNKESFVGETKELGKFYTVFEVNIGDSVKDLSEIDRVHVHQRETNSVYSFEEDEMTPFAKIMEELYQLEVTRLNSYVDFDNLILNAQKSIKISFYVHEQKENGAIYETSNLDLVIADSKYLGIAYFDIFEVVDQEALEEILNQIQNILELNSNKN